MRASIRLIPLPFLLVGFAVWVAAAGAATAPSGPMLLVNYDGPVPTVTLPSGAPVGAATAPGTLIPAGTYTIDISVIGGSPDFQLVGPGVDFVDSEPTEEVFTLTFEPNSTYTYEDLGDPAATTRLFSTTATVATSTTATTTETSTTAESNSDLVGSATATVGPPRPGRLFATVSAANAASLTEHGAPVAALAAGRYTLVIEDRSAHTAFVLRKVGHAPIASSLAPFRGRRSLMVDLSAGTWTYSAGAGPKTVFVVRA
jgi:hypothetical protein